MLLHAIRPAPERDNDLHDAAGWLALGDLLREKGDLKGSTVTRRRASNIVAAKENLCADATWKKSRPPPLSLPPLAKSPPNSPFMAAEASLRDACLEWWETALTASDLARGTAGAVSDAVGIAVAPLVALDASGAAADTLPDTSLALEQGAEAATEKPQCANPISNLSPTTSPFTSAEASLQQYIHGLVWPWIGATEPNDDAESPSSASTDTPRATAMPQAPLHRPLPDPASPITPFMASNLRS